jgi:hypothetical protein
MLGIVEFPSLLCFKLYSLLLHCYDLSIHTLSTVNPYLVPVIFSIAHRGRRSSRPSSTQTPCPPAQPNWVVKVGMEAVETYVEFVSNLDKGKMVNMEEEARQL